MPSDDIIVAIKLFLEVGNDDYINLCNFGDRSISDFKVIEGGLRAHPNWIGLNIVNLYVTTFYMPHCVAVCLV